MSYPHRSSRLALLVRRTVVVVGLLAAVVGPAVGVSPKFFSDDPIAREPDPADASGVEPFAVHLTWDIISSLFVKQGDRETRPAQNINTIDEVPDSSWFTNRAGSRPLTVAEVAQGPDTTDGPVKPWKVVSGKSEGVRAGFTIVDAAGIRWFLKLDPPGYPEQATSAEVVSTKLFWALGYNVAETHVATVRPEELGIDEKATILMNGKHRPLTAGDVRRVLDRSERNDDGSYQVVASRALEGKPVGEFLYYGTRADDPNDIVLHENRRELRGMAVFAAWIDRVDAKAGNTLDTLVNENGKTIVRHHPLDFGSTLGSAGIGPNDYWEGYEYLYAGSPLLKKLPGFGFPVESWRTIRYPDLRGIGRIEGDRFDPEEWRSRVPNAAYIRADNEDQFWAARKVMAIGDGMIAAAVKSGQYSDPSALRYLTEALIKRRDAIGRAYLTKINPVVNPALDGAGVLAFENAAVDNGFVPSAAVSYDANWFVFDNLTGQSAPLGAATVSETPKMGAPASLPTNIGSFLRIDVRSLSAAHPAWADPVSAYFRRTTAGWKLVGLERE